MAVQGLAAAPRCCLRVESCIFNVNSETLVLDMASQASLPAAAPFPCHHASHRALATACYTRAQQKISISPGADESGGGGQRGRARSCACKDGDRQQQYEAALIATCYWRVI